MAPLTIQKATKSFGGVQILHGIDIDIEDGEFVVLVGPSGCGKSTLLRLIAGLEDITTGEIRIDDKDVSRLHPKDRDIAMVFQSYALYPHMTVAENMGFSLRMRGATSEARRRKVEEAAGILDLSALLDRYPRQLSGGQRQRVAMGRSIVRDPKVFLFDEPLSNLDAKLRVQMRSEIRSLHKTLKTTIVYVTHDQIEAMTMADKIVVMRGGYVEQIGSPMTLYDVPENVFVAGFIGSPAMNLIKGHIGVDRRAFDLDGGGSLQFDAELNVAVGQSVTLGIRPEDVMLSDSGSPATVKLIEPTGAELHVNLDISGTELTAVFHERLLLSEGQDVSLSIATDRVHLFDSETEMRVSAE